MIKMTKQVENSISQVMDYLGIEFYLPENVTVEYNEENHALITIRIPDNVPVNTIGEDSTVETKDGWRTISITVNGKILL